MPRTPQQPPTRTSTVGRGPHHDPETPAASRICNYVLGGALNFPADRGAALRLLSVIPHYTLDLRANHEFRNRAVRYLLGRGIRQFLDLGSGLSSSGAVHEIAHLSDPTARIVYLDHDPIVVERTREVLGDAPGVDILHADLRSPVAVLGSATLLDLLDLTKPIGLLATSVLHFVPYDDELAGVMGVYRSALPRGSYLVLSHATAAHLTYDQALEAVDVYNATPTPLTLRTPQQIATLFAGYELLPPDDDTHPAVVPVGEWRWGDELRQPDDRARGLYGGVGYLPS